MKTGSATWSKRSLCLVVGIAGCGSPPAGAGGDGSGESGSLDDDAVELDSSDGGDAPMEATGHRGGGGGSDDGGEAPDDDAPPEDSAGGPTVSCPCGTAADFTHAWIPSPQDGTVLKVDVDTMTIDGAFATHADLRGRPMSTAVSIDGRAVAVANGAGGLMKVWTDAELCDPDRNGFAGLQTSGNGTPMTYGLDDCVDWAIPLDFDTQIPVAWGPGAIDPASCEYESQVVWTAGCDTTRDTASSVVRVDGGTGVTLDVIEMSGFPCDGGAPTFGAVDREGALWIASSTTEQPRVARLSAAGALLLYERPPLIPAGMAIDAAGRLWLSSRVGSGPATAARYTVGDASWDLAQNVVALGISGIAEDAAGRMWLGYDSYAGNDPTPGVTYVDADGVQVGPPLAGTCGGGRCTGVALDFRGRVWSSASADAQVYRYDPIDGQVAKLDDVRVSPYSSDITGWALQNAACLGVP